MSPRAAKTPRTRRNLIIGAGVFLIAALGLGWALARSAALPLSSLTGGLLVGGLSILNALLILALTAMILREAVKLAFEWQRGQARYKTRLLLSFLGLSLLPAILLPIAAYSLVQQSINRWFDASAGSVTQSGLLLAEQSYGRFREMAGRQTTLAVRDQKALLEALAVKAQEGKPRRKAPKYPSLLDAPGKDCGARLAGMPPAENYGLDFFAASYPDGLTCARPDSGTPPPPGMAQLQLTPDGAALVIDQPDGGQWVVARRQITLESSELITAYGGIHLPHSLSAQARQLAAAAAAWREEQAQKKSIKAMVLSFFLIITLTILVFVIWVAGQLTRAVTRPIERLVAGTQRLAAGDLDAPIEAAGSDEIGALVTAFNRLAGDLKAERLNRESQATALLAARTLAETQRELLRGLLDHLEAGVVLLDGAGALLMFNPAAEKLCGAPLAPALGRALAGEAGAGGFPWPDILATRPAAPVRLTAPRGNESRHLEIRATPLEEGQIIYLMEDVTDLVRAERLGAWQEVAQKLAHEIKNPLTPIQLAAERLLGRRAEAPPALAAVIDESGHAIRAEVIALKKLVDEFSRFARLPAVEPRPADLAPIALSVAELYRGEGAKIHFAPPAGPVLARLDPEAMRRVLINLLDNARAAGSQEIWMTLGRAAGSVQLEISDNGPGIPAELRSRIFSPFFTTKHGGTGLGLAIAARIVKELGGELRVDDRPGGGARFTVILQGAE